MKSKKSFSYYLGNLLIIFSIVGFGYFLYPIVGAYLFPPQVTVLAHKKGTYLTIPKINAQSPVVLNVNPWNEKVYKEALKKGVAQAAGTSLPGENGTIFIFAHSSGMPWELTRFNTIFLRLGELDKGDDIEIQRDGVKYVYKVREKKEVSPEEVSYLINTKRNQLILQTCTPIGTSLRRLLIFADPQK